MKNSNIKDRESFESYEDYEKYYFNKMDAGWELPQPTDEEIDMIHRMAKSYCNLLLEDFKDKPDKIQINKLYQLMFKLNMLLDPNGEKI